MNQQISELLNQKKIQSEDYNPKLAKLLKFGRIFLSWPTVIGSVIIFLTIVMMLLSLLPAYDMKNIPKGESYRRPSLKHSMGTDSNGRGILSKLIASSGAYFFPSLLALSIALSAGVFFGSISGYYTPEGCPKGAREKMHILSLPWFLSGGDHLIRYGFDLINSLPQLALIFLICATVSTNIYWITGALGVMGAMKLGSLLRNEIIALRQEEYVEAAIELGLSDATILRRHLLLTRLSPLLISQAFYIFAEVILVETTLRFFFQIIPDAENSWGKLLVDAQNLIFTLLPIRQLGKEPVHLWWFWFFPALLIVANIIAFYLLADAFSVKREI